MLWIKGGEKAYGKFITWGTNNITTAFSSMDKAEFATATDKSHVMLCYYDEEKVTRRTNINLEYLLPIVLLLAWHLSLFVDRNIPTKKSLKFLGINFGIVFILQIFFPLLLYKVSESAFKSLSVFIGLQIFGFLAFFLIIKDSFIIRYMNRELSENQKEK